MRWTAPRRRKCLHLIRHGSAVPPSPHRGKALDRRRYKTRPAGPGGLDGSFGFSHLGGDDGEGGDDDNGDGGPADDGGALLQHGLEAQGRADSGDAKQDGRDDKAAQLRVFDKPEQAVNPDIAVAEIMVSPSATPVTMPLASTSATDSS